MNSVEYTNFLSKLTDNELEKEEEEIYNDCVFYNDCSECPNKFTNDVNGINCRLDTITLFKKECEDNG